MSDLSIGLIQAVLLPAVGYLSDNRRLLAVAALCAAVATLAIGYPDSLSKPWPELASSLVGIVAGLALGWAAIRAQDRRSSMSARQRTLAAAALARRGGARRALIAGLAAMLLLAVAGALFVEDDTLRALRGTAQGWLNPSARAGDAGKAMTAGQSASQAGAASGGTARPPAPDDPARRKAAAERPRGDLRHCLDLSSASDVLRCAER
jgi:hypothetical protein